MSSDRESRDSIDFTIGTARRITRPARRILRAVRTNLSNRVLRLRSKLEARRVSREIARLKARHPGRPVCGILLIEHIGDIIACEPVVEWAKANHPGALVVWVVRPRFAELLTGHPKIDAVLRVDSMLSTMELVRSNPFDVCIDLHINGKVTEIDGLPYRRVSGDPAVDMDSYFKMGSLLQAFARGAGLPPINAEAKLHLAPTVISSVDRLGLPAHFVALHTTSNIGNKSWPAAAWRELVQHILDCSTASVVEVGLERTIDTSNSRVISLCGRLSIAETAEVVRRAAFFIGIDSGPAHMANAWRRPALLLFGTMCGSDTFNPYEGYYRLAADQVILRHHGILRDLPPSRVLAALEASALWNEAAHPAFQAGAARGDSRQTR